MSEVRGLLTLLMIAGCGVEGEALLIESAEDAALSRAAAQYHPTCDCDPTEDMEIVTRVGACEIRLYCDPVCDWPDISLVGLAGHWRKEVDCPAGQY